MIIEFWVVWNALNGLNSFLGNSLSFNKSKFIPSISIKFTVDDYKISLRFTVPEY